MKTTKAELGEDTNIIVSGILPRYGNYTNSEYENKRKTFNELLCGVCEENAYNGVYFIPQNNFVADDFHDGVHLASRPLSKLVRNYKYAISPILGLEPYHSHDEDYNSNYQRNSYRNDQSRGHESHKYGERPMSDHVHDRERLSFDHRNRKYSTYDHRHDQERPSDRQNWRRPTSDHRRDRAHPTFDDEH